MKTRIGPSMRVALEYVQRNPGVNTAEVDRARRTARGGHRWMYATVQRLVAAGLLRTGRATSGRGVGLYAVKKTPT